MANPNPNQENLIPINDRPDHKEISSRAGIKSGIARQKKKSMQEDALWVLNLAMGEGELMNPDEIVEYSQLKGRNITTGQAMIAKALLIAINDPDPKDAIKAMEFLRDTSGQKPTDSLNVQGNINNPMSGLTTDELRALAYENAPKPKKKRGRPKKVTTDD